MATAPTEGLLGKIRDFRSRERSDYAKLAASVPIALGASMSGGPAAANAAVDRLYARPEADRLTKSTKVGLKAEVIKLLDDADKFRTDARLKGAGKAAERAKETNDLVVKMVDASMRAGDAQASANATVIASVNNGLANIDGNTSQFYGTVINAMKGGNSQGVNSAIGLLQDAMRANESGGQADAGVVDDITAIINKMVAEGDTSSLGALKAAGDQIARQFGAGSLESWLSDAATIPGATGDQAYTSLQAMSDPEIATRADDVSEKAMLLAEASKLALASKLVKGTSNVNKKAGEFFDMMAQKVGLSGEGSVAGSTAEDVGKEIDAMLGEQDPAAREAALKLLSELDKDDIPEASNLAEARRQLFADDEFKQWMADNNFKDPTMALREMSRMAKKQVFDNRQSDREVVRSRRLAGVGPTTNSPTAGAVGIGEERKPSLASRIAQVGYGIRTPEQSISAAGDDAAAAVSGLFGKLKKKKKPADEVEAEEAQ